MSGNIVSSYTGLDALTWMKKCLKAARSQCKSVYLAILARSSEPYCRYCKRILFLLLAAVSHIEASISAFAEVHATVSVSVSSMLGSGRPAVLGIGNSPLRVGFAFPSHFRRLVIPHTCYSRANFSTTHMCNM